MITLKYIRLIKNFILARYFSRKYPLYLQIELTRRCNYRCEYCKLYEDAKEEIPKETLFRMIDEVEKDCCFINLEGGEPLLRKDLGEIVDYIKSKKGIFLSITTNGYYLKNKIDILKKMDSIMFSLDGPKEIHDLHRGEGAFDKVIEGIKIAKSHGLRVSVLCVITKHNIDKLEMLMQLVQDLHVDNLMMNPVTQATNISDKELEAIAIDKPVFAKAMQRMHELDKTAKKLVHSKSSLKFYLNHFPYFSYDDECYFARIAAYINTNGFVQPCCGLKSHSKNHSIYNGSLHKIMRDRKIDCTTCVVPYNLDLKFPLGLHRYMRTDKHSDSSTKLSEAKIVEQCQTGIGHRYISPTTSEKE